MSGLPQWIDREGHTARDAAALIEALGPDGPHLTQPRDHAVSCWACGRATYHQGGGCDEHYVAPFAVQHPDRYRVDA